KVGYEGNPLENGELSDYVVQPVAMTTLTLGAVEAIGASKKDGQRAKNMFALGLLSWMYGRQVEASERFIREKFARKPDIAEANVLALKAGWNYGETTEAFGTTYDVSPAKLPAGEYRQISGNSALAYGIVTAGQLAGVQVVLGSYPITPASDILHELSKHKNFNVVTFQAEDEIGGVCAALGAAYGGALGVTSTSGPGLSLKSEAIGLGVMAELPLLVIDVQRAGPSTGMPTKTEQADLLQAMYGRNGESPVAVLAPRSPSDCFETAVEAVRIALCYHTPVIVLSDGAIANGSEPWLIPDLSSIAPIEHVVAKAGEPFQPYARDPETLARQFAIPGTPGLEHRIGGLEAANGSGNISYEPANHDLMVRLRQAKIDGIRVPDLEVDDPTGDAELLLVGWGSTYGPIGEACRRARRKGIKVAHAHLRYLNPLPANLGDVLRRYPKVVAPEMNLGQLALLLRGKYLVDIQLVTKVQGVSFLADEVGRVIRAALGGTLAEIEQDKTMVARLAAATVGSGVGADA
ncbi:MAG: 2-oxoacid:acceptor oxidoreductase subunit alpha, partial [Mycobacterium sp.]